MREEGSYQDLTWMVRISLSKIRPCSVQCTVDDRQVGHVNQVGHLSKTPLNLLEIHEIGSVETSESK